MGAGATSRNRGQNLVGHGVTTVSAVVRVLVTGMSGTGKTTVLNELQRRGHVTVDVLIEELIVPT